MSDTDIKTRIKTALAALKGGDLHDSARILFNAMGYSSERVPGGYDSPQAFVANHPSLIGGKNTKSEKEFLAAAESVNIIFQVTGEEIQSSIQMNLLEGTPFDPGLKESFLFAAVKLKHGNYARGKYAAMTREINKRLAMPAVVLFVDGDQLTLAFVHRRAAKTDSTRDVLEKVTLIRNVDCQNPHRAHLDILAELSLAKTLQWMELNGMPKNFDGLLAAWLAKLDTEELNKRFYKKLLDWYEWAIETAKFPRSDNKPVPIMDHIIRLITRILFVWFVKEKGLVHENLFSRHKVAPLLKSKCATDGDDYYRAVLQNLFFATLNTEIARRGFSKAKQTTHRNFNLYRYKDLLSDADGLLDLMGQTPFINGGLFDCLDSEKSTSHDGYRLDCFSDNEKHRKQLSVPNCLFFDDHRGLFPLLNKYKFTVEENTPIEQEVALDPELLGKVFENLLAAYNPETRETARKQTGSYYTPRAIVDYMVDEALVASLAEKAEPSVKDAEYWQARLRYLLDYEDAFNDANELFEEEEVAAIVTAISEIKVLDPAVGSGAFPMGVLHKLALALRRIDPENKIWQELQKKRAQQRASAAFDSADSKARDAELLEINKTFEQYRDSDFGRKLYLIQNSLFGVDIQPIACQIAKLRFFISLTIEQQPNDDAANNFGIKPLPNLETRFVAANALLGLEKPAQMSLAQTPRVTELENNLKGNREKHFHTSIRAEKLACQARDKELRRELSDELSKICFSTDDAEKISQWNPYDQNASAGWFDSEYMFGVRDGFDIVVGNPPYVQLQKAGGRLGKLYENSNFKTFTRTGDIYQLFYEKGMELLTDARGVLMFITSNSWMRAQYGKKLRQFFSTEHSPLLLIDVGKDAFDAIVDTNILLIQKGNSKQQFKAVDMDSIHGNHFPPADRHWSQIQMSGNKVWSILSPAAQAILSKIEQIGTPLKEWEIQIYRGVTTGCNDAFIIDNEKRNELIASDPKSADIIKPVLRGRDIQRYGYEWAGKWLIYARKGFPVTHYPSIHSHLLQHEQQLSNKAGANAWYELQASPSDTMSDLFSQNKLIWIELVDRGRFSYDNKAMYCEATTFMMTGNSLRYLCAILNSNLIYWYLSHTAPTSGMGVLRWKKVYVEMIPIPVTSKQKQKSFVALVNKILAEKQKSSDADTSHIEAEIDQLVYQLYGLTEKEIKLVEAQ